MSRVLRQVMTGLVSIVKADVRAAVLTASGEEASVRGVGGACVRGGACVMGGSVCVRGGEAAAARQWSWGDPQRRAGNPEDM